MTTLYDTNAYLSQDQMNVNAQDLLDFFLGQNWKKESICAMLGNMQSESTINYGIYESLDSTSTTNGFGLCQWTPNTKYFDWASANGYGSDHVNGEKNRILYEVANAIQWVPDGHYVRYGLSHAYDFSFADFTNNVGGYTTQQLADAWCWNYEGPANPDQPDRATQAQYYYDNLTGSGSGGGGTSGGGTTTTTTNTNQQTIALFLCGALHGWK